MPKNEPALRISILKRGNPRCSVCGEEFGSEGLTKALIDAFALHVRRRHVPRARSYRVAYAQEKSERLQADVSEDTGRR